MKRRATAILAGLFLAGAATADPPSAAPADGPAPSAPAPAAPTPSGAPSRAAAPAGEPAEPLTVYRVAKVVTMDDQNRVINNAAVVVSGSRILSVGRAADVPTYEGASEVVLAQCWLVPGLVDCHNHTAGSLSDLNDGVYLTNPGLRTLDTIVPDSEEVVRARGGGVAAGLLIPGSGNNMSGLGAVVKFGGRTVEEMLVRSPGSIKIAQAGNPEGYWYGVGRSFMNYNTRRTLEAARDYHLARAEFEAGRTPVEPPFDPVFDELRGLFRGEFAASVHTQQYQLVMTTLDMLARKLKVRVILDHSTFDAWKVAPVVLELGEDRVTTICGPRTLYLDPTLRRITGIAAGWWGRGLRNVGVNTDAPVIPQEELSFQAAMNCYFGWRPYEALRGVTRVPAEALQVGDRTGSIRAGQDADFGIWTGDPIDPRSTCVMLVINGRVERDARGGRRF